MIERLAQFIQSQGLSVRAFELSIKASDGMIRRAINNKSDIQSKWITLIADNYPHLNLDWLITGKGSMLRDSHIPEENKPTSPKISPTEESIIYNMYKEKDAKVEELLKENGRLEERIRQLEAQDNKSEHHIIIDQVTEAFTAESSGAYVRSSSLTKKNSISETSSEERI